jgi:hypothetical protein
MTSHSIIGLAHLIAGALSSSDSTVTACQHRKSAQSGLKLLVVLFIGLTVGMGLILVPLIRVVLDQVLKNALNESDRLTIVIASTGAAAASLDDGLRRNDPSWRTRVTGLGAGNLSRLGIPTPPSTAGVQVTPAPLPMNCSSSHFAEPECCACGASY